MDIKKVNKLVKKIEAKDFETVKNAFILCTTEAPNWAHEIMDFCDKDELKQYFINEHFMKWMLWGQFTEEDFNKYFG